MSQKFFRRPSGLQYGGAALEYILVTAFAAVVSITALGVIAKVVDQELDKLAERTGITRDDATLFDE